MPLYTGTGDDGHTGLFGRRRVPKSDVRIEAYGTVDELNSVLGMLRSDVAAALASETRDELARMDEGLAAIQNSLFEIGADLATEGGTAAREPLAKAIPELERWIDESEAALPPLRTFVLPGGSRIAAGMHLARTVARRAERRYWELTTHAPDVPREIGVFLNRLSDLLFSWARRANAVEGVPDVAWRRTTD